jgi:hypothetical protein
MTLTPAEINLAVVNAHMQGEVSDPASIMNLYAEGIVLDMPSRDIRLTDPQAIEDNYRALFGAIQILSMEPLDRFATHDRVVDDCIVQFTVTGKGYARLPFPVGAIIELRLLHVFHMKDGKIARENVFEAWKPIQ